MQVFTTLEQIPRDFGPTVVTVGNFDGVHLAHQAILREICRRAGQLQARPLLLTFDPHPERILHPHGGPALITPQRRKLKLLEACGLDAVLILPFTRDLSLLPAFQFAEEILFDTLHAVEVHEGFNFRFGHKAEAGIERLREFGAKLGFAVVTHAPMRRGGLVVSSSNVRAAVAAGRMAAARHLLGRSFSLDSTPARGRGYGTKYTVPTINLSRYDELIPAFGVYVTEMWIGGERFHSVTNVGNRPTFGPDSFAIESYLFNFHPLELSSSTPVRLEFLHRLRGEVKFPSIEDLKAQISRDMTRAERYFRLHDRLPRH